MRTTDLIASIKQKLSLAKVQIKECKSTINKLEKELNNLLDLTGVTKTSTKKRKRKKDTHPPLKVGDFVSSKSRPNLGIGGQITGRTRRFFIVTPQDSSRKKFRKEGKNLADLSLRENSQF